MKLPVISAAAAALAAALTLSACDEGYGSSGVAIGWSGPYAYDTYYDGYYGPLYDGYWGDDGGFWYRSGDRGHYRRGDGTHFRHDIPGDGGTGRSWQRYQGRIDRPYGRMPNFPRDHH